MTPPQRSSISLAASLAFTLICFTIGITWGLPSRSADPFLFGDRPAWDGEAIQRLAGDRQSGDLGADVDRNPILNRSQPVVLNATDAQRAEIIRRYRLYTTQPDEMITMMALASMSPARRDFDPKLYQYGGLWIYPVGGLLKIASMVHLIDLSKPQTFYLDHPEMFARFYIIARLYCIAWAIIGAAAVYALIKRWTNDPRFAAAATIAYGLMPVVINMAHEAKPHLPAAALVLWAVYFAAKYVDTGLRRWWVFAGLASGGAVAMLLSAMPALLIPVAMVLLRKENISQRLIVLVATMLLAVDLYLLTNPYVLLHALHDRTVLLSNLRNSQAMYTAPPSPGGLWNAVKLIGTGATPLVGFAGLFALIAVIRKRDPAAILLAMVSFVVFTQFAIFATNKPGEFSRFALVVDIALLLAAVGAMSHLRANSWIRWLALLILVLNTGFYAAGYDWHFARDASARPTRTIIAERLRDMNRDGDSTLALAAEPAPYSMPPVNLWTWQLLLAPPGQLLNCNADVTLRTVDHSSDQITRAENGYYSRDWIRFHLPDTSISWAAKPFEIGEKIMRVGKGGK